MTRPTFTLLDTDAAAVAALPKDMRQAIELAAAGENYQTISFAIGHPVGMVKSRLHWARAKIVAARVSAQAAE